MEQTILAFIGQMVLVGGGGAAVGFLLFKSLGEKYIDHKFAARLEALKHDQNVIVARLRVEIESMLSGALKFQEREFEVLPAMWALLDKAYGHLGALVSPFQRFSKVFPLSDELLNEFLANEEMTESQKQQVRETDGFERQHTYNKIMTMYQFGRVQDYVREYSTYLASNSIFMPLDLLKKLNDLDALMWSVWSTKEIAKQGRSDELGTKAREELEKIGKPLFEEIQHDVRLRLESHMKAAQLKSA